MTSPRFFCPLPLVSGACVDLPESAARHAARALRLSPGDAVVLFDGGGGEYACRIVEVTRRGVTVEVGEHSARECESPLQLTLVQALQSGDKMDFTVQKAVELGVAGIVPVLSRRSVLRLSGERATNPFLRAAEPAIAAALNMPGAPPLEVFTSLRAARNRF